MKRVPLYLSVAISLIIAMVVHDSLGLLQGGIASALVGFAVAARFGQSEKLFRTPGPCLRKGALLVLAAVIIYFIVPMWMSHFLAYLAFPILAASAYVGFADNGPRFAILRIGDPDLPQRQHSAKIRLDAANLKLKEVSDRLAIPILDVRPDVDFNQLELRSGATLFITGSFCGLDLVFLCKRAQASGFSAVIVIDALQEPQQLLHALEELNEKRVQITIAEAVSSIITDEQLMVYQFPKADHTITLVCYLPGSHRVLVIQRDRPPFVDKLCLPGGFLNVFLESLPQGGVRELLEECFRNDDAREDEYPFTTSFDPGELILVDVRSQPYRDSRGHIIDTGYLLIVPPEREEEVVRAVNAGDDAKPNSARFEPVEKVISSGLAFDHMDLLLAALKVVESWRCQSHQ